MHRLHALVHRAHNPDLGILFVRIALGVAFIHAGWLKVANIGMAIEGFGQMGWPAWVAVLVAYVELIAGVLVVVGFLARYAGIALAVIMAVATLAVHLPAGYSLPNGYAYTLNLFLLSLAVVALGSGAYSLARRGRKICGGACAGCPGCDGCSGCAACGKGATA